MSFRGILFLGVMMTASGPKLLEYNVRLGDPEAEAILVRLETDIVDICAAMLRVGGAISGEHGDQMEAGQFGMCGACVRRLSAKAANR